MPNTVLAAVQRLTPKSRGVHLVTSMADGLVRLQIWDARGKLRLETTMSADWFGEEAMMAAEAFLDEMDPLPIGPQLVK